MKAECLKDRLVEAVGKADKFTGKNVSLPILKCVYIEADVSGFLLIRATNLDVGIEIKVPARVVQPGAVAVPGGTLNHFLSHLPNEKGVVLEEQEGNLVVSTGKNKTILKAYPCDDFPTIPKLDKKTEFVLPAEVFVNGIKSVWYSSATTSIKPELSSVRVAADKESSSLVFVATDGFRLAEKKISIKKVPDLNQVLVPVKNAVEIMRLFDGAEGDLSICVEQNQFCAEYEGKFSCYVVSRSVEGNFPDYKTIIPNDFTTEISVLRQDVSNAFKAGVIFSDSFHHIRFSVNVSDKNLEISTKNAEVGEYSSKINCSAKGEDIGVNFNYKYINDSLQSTTGESLSLSFGGANKPLVIRSTGDTSFLYLVMPMNR